MITGGAGYIGSHTAKALAKAGYTPVVADNLENGHREAVKWGPLHVIDLGDPSAVDSLFARHAFDAVIHFAAYISVGESMANPAKYYRNNVANAINVLDAMSRHGVRTFVFSSTAAVYGVPKTVPIPEDHPLQPNNAYGETKLAVERMLPWFAFAHGLSYAALRYFNAAGADPSGDTGEAHPEETHLIPLALRATSGPRHALKLFGGDYPTPDGTAVRDYIHVADLADAHVQAMRRLAEGLRSGAYNLGTGRGYSVREVIEAIERVSGLKVHYDLGPRRPGDVPELVADCRKAMRELGWTPRHSSLDEIVRTAWAWEESRKAGAAL